MYAEQRQAVLVYYGIGANSTLSGLYNYSYQIPISNMLHFFNEYLNKNMQIK